jgi:ribosome maturation factor RimP
MQAAGACDRRRTPIQWCGTAVRALGRSRAIFEKSREGRRQLSTKENGRRIHELAQEALADLGLVVEDVAVTPAGKRRLVRIAVDQDLSRLGLDDDSSTVPPLTLDEVADATRAVSAALDEGDVMGASPYVLEVSSPGVDRPLTAPRHFRRNVGRLVQVERPAGGPVRGRLLSAGAEGVTVLTEATKGQPEQEAQIPYAEIDRAQVQVEFARGTDEEDS